MTKMLIETKPPFAERTRLLKIFHAFLRSNNNPISATNHRSFEKTNPIQFLCKNQNDSLKSKN